MVSERMCCGIVKSDLMLRLTPETRQPLYVSHIYGADGLHWKADEVMIFVEAAGIESDSSLERWVRSAEQLAGALPGTIGNPSVRPGKARSVRQLGDETLTRTGSIPKCRQTK